MRIPEVMRHAFVVLVVFAMFAPSMTAAQDLRMEERSRPVAPAPPRHDATAPPASGERDARVEHDPAFIPPFVGTFETPTGRGQYGLSGWTSPNTPIGPTSREVNGWFSFGFTLTWDGKPPAAATAVR